MRRSILLNIYIHVHVHVVKQVDIIHSMVYNFYLALFGHDDLISISFTHLHHSSEKV